MTLSNSNPQYIKEIGTIEEDVIEQGFTGDEIHCFKCINIKYAHPYVDGRLSPIEHLAVRIAELRKILVKAYSCNPMIHGVYISTTSLVNLDKAIEPLKQPLSTEFKVFLHHPTLMWIYSKLPSMRIRVY